MKNKNITLFLFFIGYYAVGQSVFSLYSEQDTQGSRLKIKSSITVQQFFAVPMDVDATQLGDLDFAVMTPKNHGESIIETIGDNNDLTIIKLLEHPETCIPSMFDDITGIKLDIEGVRVYGPNGDEVYALLNDSDEIANYTIAEQELYSYGLYNSWFGMQNNASIDSIINHFSNEGFTTEWEDGVLLAVNDTLEVEIDFEYLVYEERYFENDTIVLISQKRFSDINGKYIPLQDITIRYNFLPSSGIKYQIGEVKTYNYYEIINNLAESVVVYGSSNGVYSLSSGEGAVFQYQEIEKHNHQLTVYPNPTTEVLHVELPFNITGKINVEIYNIVGQLISRTELIAQKTLNINTEKLPKGSYIIKCSSDKNVASKIFIKQ